jgi:hypothetical protein
MDTAKEIAEELKAGVETAMSRAAALLEMISEAALDVIEERERQIKVEGWSDAHDDAHDDGSLSQAAACYAMHAGFQTGHLSPAGDWYPSPPKDWPWDRKWWKPTNTRRDLVKAGALIIAELERIDRAAARK